MDNMTFDKQAVAAPDILLHLFREYEKSLENAGVAELEGVLKTTAPFIRFARNYLDENRPRTFQPGDNNYDLILSNGQRVAISPADTGVRGTMAPVAGKTVDSTPGNMKPDVYANQGAIPISGNTKGQKGATDYSTMDGKGVVDKAADKPGTEFNPKHGRQYADDLLNR